MNLKIKIYNSEKVLTADNVELIRVNAALIGVEGESEVQVLELNRDYPLGTTAEEIKEDLVKARTNFINETAAHERDGQVDATISELNGVEIE